MRWYVVLALAIAAVYAGAFWLVVAQGNEQPQCREGHWEHVKRDRDIWVCDLRDPPAGQKIRERESRTAGTLSSLDRSRAHAAFSLRGCP